MYEVSVRECKSKSGGYKVQKILIVDDEKLERKGIRFLLKQRTEEYEITEAANGKAACDLLKKQPVDILFTDIKMPYMDGLELAEQARRMCPGIEIVIFSGYGEFEYARKAMKVGVKDYVLKPVDPGEFHRVLDDICKRIETRKKKEADDRTSQDFLQQYFLGRYLYHDSREFFEKMSEQIDVSRWRQIQGLILIESEDHFFEESEECFMAQLAEETHQKYLFLNLSQSQELCVVCSACDQAVLAQHISDWLNQTFGNQFYGAAGRPVQSLEELPEAFQDLEVLMENKFYRREERLFLPEKPLEQATPEEFLDDLLHRMIEDIRLDDILHLWEHNQILQENCGQLSCYSQIYTKFLFSNLVKEFYLHQHVSGHKLEEAIQQVYEFRSMQEVLRLVEGLIMEMEQALDDSKEHARNEVAQAKSYIYEHYNEDISVDTLADQVYLSSGYFSYIFKKETGVNVSRFIRCYRMEKAKELLSDTNMKIVQICKETGFANVSYFCKSFREYCGCSPEQYRKGDVAHESSEEKI